MKAAPDVVTIQDVVNAGACASDVLGFVSQTGLIAAPYSVVLAKASWGVGFYVRRLRLGFSANSNGYGCVDVVGGGYNGSGEGPGYGFGVCGDGHGRGYRNYGNANTTISIRDDKGDGSGYGEGYGTADDDGCGEPRVKGDGGCAYDPRIITPCRWRWRRKMEKR